MLTYAVIDKVNSGDIYAYVHNHAAMCPIFWRLTISTLISVLQRSRY